MSGQAAPTRHRTLGDFVRCLARLKPGDEQTAQLLAAQLGYDLDKIPEQIPPPAPTSEDMPPSPSARDTFPEVPHGLPVALPPVTPRTQSQSTSAKPGSDPGPTIPVEDAQWPASSAPIHEPMPQPPLFDRQLSREIVRASVTTRHADGGIDIAGCVRAVARGKPLRRLPRRLCWGAFGADILIHTCQGMLPYRRDQAALVEQVARLLGAAAVRVWWFYHSPDELFESMMEGDAWEVSATRPVLVLSDLGAGDSLEPITRHQKDAWLAFSTKLAHAPSALVLTPYGKDTALIDLYHGAAVETWDECTTPSAIRRAQRQRRQRWT